MSTMSTSLAKAAVRTAGKGSVPSNEVEFIPFKTDSLKDMMINISSRDPMKIECPKEETVVNIFPRAGDLLFIVQSEKKKFNQITIYPKSNVANSKTVNLDRRGQAVIDGKFSGAYVLSITKESK